MAPLVAGAAISALTGVVQGISQIASAAEQRKRAAELREQAAKVEAPPIAKQYLESDRIKEWQAANGMPGYQQYKDDLASNTASATQVAEGVSGSGSNTLAAVASLYGNQNRATNELNAKDATVREENVNGLVASKAMLGRVADQNQAIKREQQNQIRQQAGALENASTANQTSGISGITGSIGKGIAGGLGAAAGSGGTSGNVTVNPDGSGGSTGTAPTPPTVDTSTSSDEQAGYGALQSRLGLVSTPGLHPSQDTPENITQAQSHLIGLGLYHGPADGVYTPELGKAMAQYDPTGVPYKQYPASVVAPLYNSAY